MSNDSDIPEVTAALAATQQGPAPPDDVDPPDDDTEPDDTPGDAGKRRRMYELISRRRERVAQLQDHRERMSQMGLLAMLALVAYASSIAVKASTGSSGVMVLWVFFFVGWAATFGFVRWQLSRRRYAAKTAAAWWSVLFGWDDARPVSIVDSPERTGVIEKFGYNRDPWRLEDAVGAGSKRSWQRKALYDIFWPRRRDVAGIDADLDHSLLPTGILREFGQAYRNPSQFVEADRFVVALCWSVLAAGVIVLGMSSTGPQIEPNSSGSESEASSGTEPQSPQVDVLLKQVSLTSESLLLVVKNLGARLERLEASEELGSVQTAIEASGSDTDSGVPVEGTASKKPDKR